MANTHQDLARWLKNLRVKTANLAIQQDAFANNFRPQLRRVFQTLRELMTWVQPPEPPAAKADWVCAPEGQPGRGCGAAKGKKIQGWRR